MTEKLNEPEGTAANDEFERRLAELEQILEEFPSAPPSLPGNRGLTVCSLSSSLLIQYATEGESSWQSRCVRMR